MFNWNQNWMAVAILVCCPGAMAAEAPSESGAGTGQVSQLEQKSQIAKATDLIGRSIKDRQGEELGEIEDFAVDLEQRELAYVIVSIGGLLQQKLVGVPLDTLRFDSRRDELVADLSQEDMEQAGEVSEADLPSDPTVVPGQGTMEEPEVFAELDQDGDGYLSQAEAQAGENLSEQFDQVDRNGDRLIDLTEFAAFEELKK